MVVELQLDYVCLRRGKSFPIKQRRRGGIGPARVSLLVLAGVTPEALQVKNIPLLFYLAQDEAGEIQVIGLEKHHRHIEKDLPWRDRIN